MIIFVAPLALLIAYTVLVQNSRSYVSYNLQPQDRDDGITLTVVFNYS